VTHTLSAQTKLLPPDYKIKQLLQVKKWFNPSPYRVTTVDTTGFGGEPGVEWERSLSDLVTGGRYFSIYRLLQLTNGSYLAAGDIYFPDSAAYAYVKFNQEGNVLNKIILKHTTEDYPSVCESNDSGWYAIYKSFKDPNGNSGYYHTIQKYNKDGIIEWQKLYNNTNATSGEAIVSTKDGGVMLAYFRQSEGKEMTCYQNNIQYGGDTYFDRIHLLKFTNTGQLLWEKEIFRQDYYRLGVFLFGMRLLNTKDGYFLTTNYSPQNRDSSLCWNYNNNFRDIFIGKVSESGDSLFTKRIGGSLDEILIHASPIVADSGILISGYTGSNNGTLAGVKNNTDSHDAWIVKLNNNGDIVFNKTYRYGNKQTTLLLSGIALSDSGYIVSAYSYNNDVDGIGVLIKMDKNGHPLWTKPNAVTLPFEMQAKENHLFYVASSLLEEDHAVFGKLGPSAFITGSVFYDWNQNGIKDANEAFCKNCIVTSSNSGFTRGSSAGNGWFRNDVQPGSYTTSVTVSNSNYAVSPLSHTSTLDSLFQGDTIHFALQPVADIKDLSVTAMAINAARPGFPLQYKIKLKNEGTTIPAASLFLVKDSRISFVSAIPAPVRVNGDSIVWNYSGFQPESDSVITVNLKVNAPPATSIGDTLSTVVFVAANTSDVNLVNDSATVRQLVIGSYDPNDKSENFAGKIPVAKVASGDYIYYLIRFQNTGTDTAFTVVVSDTLDAGLDWPSLQMVGASHTYQLTVQDQNKIKWLFPTIHLPDSNRNEPLSHGYIFFRIRPKQNLKSGDVVNNKAFIYFDYNLPVITNQVSSTVVSEKITAVPSFIVSAAGIRLYPNPSTGNITVGLNGAKAGDFQYQIIDGNGRIVLSKKATITAAAEQHSFQLNIAGLHTGVYWLSITQKNKRWGQQLIVQ